MQLHEAGLVDQEVQLQEHLPARKEYGITAEGREKLRAWVLSNPEAPEMRNSFLIQLAWADLLDSKELIDLLDRYEKEIQLEMLTVEDELRRDKTQPKRSDREAFLWTMITDNLVKKYQSELDWIQKLRVGLASF